MVQAAQLGRDAFQAADINMTDLGWRRCHRRLDWLPPGSTVQHRCTDGDLGGVCQQAARILALVRRGGLAWCGAQEFLRPAVVGQTHVAARDAQTVSDPNQQIVGGNLAAFQDLVDLGRCLAGQGSNPALRDAEALQQAIDGGDVAGSQGAAHVRPLPDRLVDPFLAGRRDVHRSPFRAQVIGCERSVDR
jgi:hypothetical protein